MIPGARFVLKVKLLSEAFKASLLGAQFVCDQSENRGAHTVSKARVTWYEKT
jgi:hypothetical protein